ncbi:hypothetical protein BBF93_06700 [Hyphomonas sp. CACIAM 19H1]|uniref:RNA polymerase sigma factor n=1 Tax=Hyphomonas sp. CACIAM 19H1 TaxID=1873716 RepID=UPI000DED5BBD|nr:RNA polymerase sigma factor [Hyphomonas sp. CACIAM 19H1]AXE63940.1 hypothetical protein BBF93_06700 [Hyphomonas sp. CACIAM 19H1]
MSQERPIRFRLGKIERQSATDLSGEAGLDEIYRAYFQPLSAAIARTFGQGPPEPEEIVQAAFLKFMRMEDRARVENARAFLFASARNIMLDHKRRSRRTEAYVAEQLAYDPDFQLEEISPERVLEAKDRLDVLTEALKALPYKQQVVLTLNRLHGKTYAEIIEATGWSLGDISRSLNAGKAALMEALEQSEREGSGRRRGRSEP